jgi:L-iditol 2-dehydrogenase
MTTRQDASPRAQGARVPRGTMKAVVLTSPRKLHVSERPIPTPGEGEVLVRVQAVGVCGSDVHYYRDGRIGNRVVTGPLVLGHEFAGEVAALGPGVTGWKVGERVAVDPTMPCGECHFCRQGLIHVCPSVNFCGTPPTDGGYQEFFVARPANLHRLPSGLSTAEGAMVEPLAVAVHAVNLAQPKPGETVAVLGAGSIGLTVLQVARDRGARVVLVTEPLPARRALAAKLGAEQALNPQEEEAVAAALKLTDGLGPDVVFECAGTLETPQQAIDMCRPRGRVLWVGIPPGDTITLSIHEARRKELSLIMARRFLATYPQAIDLAASHRADLACLITHRFGLAETEAAFALVDRYADGVIKALIEPER